MSSSEEAVCASWPFNSTTLTFVLSIPRSALWRSADFFKSRSFNLSLSACAWASWLRTSRSSRSATLRPPRPTGRLSSREEERAGSRTLRFGADGGLTVTTGNGGKGSGQRFFFFRLRQVALERLRRLRHACQVSFQSGDAIPCFPQAILDNKRLPVRSRFADLLEDLPGGSDTPRALPEASRSRSSFSPDWKSL